MSTNKKADSNNNNNNKSVEFDEDALQADLENVENPKDHHHFSGGSSVLTTNSR